MGEKERSSIILARICGSYRDLYTSSSLNIHTRNAPASIDLALSSFKVGIAIEQPWKPDLWVPTVVEGELGLTWKRPSEEAYAELSGRTQKVTLKPIEQPYSPAEWVLRVGDAHKARLLLESVFEGKSDLTEKVLAAHHHFLEQNAQEGKYLELTSDVQANIVKATLAYLRGETWLLLATGLKHCHSLQDLADIRPKLEQTSTGPRSKELIKYTEEWGVVKSMTVAGMVEMCKEEKRNATLNGVVSVHPYP
ncbi:hypothetical protein EJ08DRAFT_665163 [Tothia fuscella]|uniref:Uncharacterized protein n=1 Tax=Tothia fuscella TaxID=1048955 RepID=A0A9P4NHC3_9PEZI|nr:hypothetical protein EJ08DRAFT_665163 [Tothia fuscella]